MSSYKDSRGKCDNGNLIHFVRTGRSVSTWFNGHWIHLFSVSKPLPSASAKQNRQIGTFGSNEWEPSSEWIPYTTIYLTLKMNFSLFNPNKWSFLWTNVQYFLRFIKRNRYARISLRFHRYVHLCQRLRTKHESASTDQESVVMMTAKLLVLISCRNESSLEF